MKKTIIDPRVRALVFVASSIIFFHACASPQSAPLSAPVLPKIPKTFLEDLIIHRKVTTPTVRIFNTGHVVIQGSAVSSLKSPDSTVRLDVPVFLIRHPKEGLILFDTGLSTSSAAQIGKSWDGAPGARIETEPGQDIVSQLKVFNPGGDVRWVILSTLDLDHSGLADAFPGATVVVSSREWDGRKARQTARKNPHDFDPASMEDRLKLRLVDFDGAPQFGSFDHAVDLFSDGSIYVVDLSGHSEGSIGAWVNMDGGPVLLAGDAALVVDNFLDLAQPAPGAAADPAQYWRKMYMMHAMLDVLPRLVILPGHDLTPRTLTDRKDLPMFPFTSGQ